MEQTEKNPVSSKRTRAQILQIVSKYEKSHGLTVKEFCCIGFIIGNIAVSTAYFSLAFRKNKLNAMRSIPAGIINEFKS